MKKRVVAWILLCLIPLLLTACNFPEGYEREDAPDLKTGQPADYIYETGEEIEFYTVKGDRKVGSFVVKNALLFPDPEQPNRTLVQINYDYDAEDADFAVDEQNLTVYDHTGRVAKSKTLPASEERYSVYTKSVYAVKSVGEYVELEITFKPDQPVARVRLYYGVGKVEENPAVVRTLVIVGALLVGAVAVLVYACVRMHNKRKEVEKELAGWEALPPQEPAQTEEAEVTEHA